MRVWITGARGMLGQSLCSVLQDQTTEVSVLATGRGDIDLRDSPAVSRFIRAERPDKVIHCAARVGGIQANIDEPLAFLRDNIAIDQSVIGGCLDAGVRSLVYLGSSCMYPKDYTQPLKEEHILAAPLEPTNEGYAIAKIAGAKLCEYAARQSGLLYRTLIPCNLYGPGDHFQGNRSHLIAAAIRKVHECHKERREAVEIWGDGTARREFLFVEDLARFIARSLSNLAELPPQLNIGFGRDYTVMEYYGAVADVVGFTGRFEPNPAKPAGMKQKLLDSTRANRLGWQPSTSLEDGIRRSYEHFLSTEEGLA